MQRPSPSSPERLNPVLHALYRDHGEGAWIPLETFVEAALYLPEAGYYRRPRERIGYRSDRDFYTASSLGPVFARLVVAAISQLLPGLSRQHKFVELGAEPSSHLLSRIDHPFAAHQTIRVGEPIELEGPCVVFSNELFDAQPFRRFRFEGGQWQEAGLRLKAGGPEPESASPVIPAPAELPAVAPEGYCLDYPSGSRRLAEQIASNPWHGLFLAFDYGHAWPVLSEHRPEGTARTYRQHRQGGDLLDSPGEQDITHHICWDHLASTLTRHRFSSPVLESQEAFFMHHATAAITRVIEDAGGAFSAERQTLKELLHPGHMGQSFQVLHARREPGVHSR